MALTLTTIRNSKIRSIFGRMLGIDRNDVLVGHRGSLMEIEDITTTSPTTASNYGVTRISGLTSTQGPTQHNLPTPIAGLTKTIIMDCTSTASQQFLSTPNGASVFAASLGTTSNAVTFRGPGGRITLLGVSTAIWSVVEEGLYQSTALDKSVAFTTSTA